MKEIVWIFLSLYQPRQISLVDEQLPLWSIIVVGLASKEEELGSSCQLVWESLRPKEYSSILSITSIVVVAVKRFGLGIIEAEGEAPEASLTSTLNHPPVVTPPAERPAPATEHKATVHGSF